MKKKSTKTDKKLPGYPAYPPQEDIMSGNADERLDVNLDDLSSQTPSSKLKTNKPGSKRDSTSPEIIPATNPDLTPDDLEMLGSPDMSNDGGDDELLSSLDI